MPPSRIFIYQSLSFCTEKSSLGDSPDPRRFDNASLHFEVNSVLGGNLILSFEEPPTIDLANPSGETARPCKTLCLDEDHSSVFVHHLFLVGRVGGTNENRTRDVALTMQWLTICL